MTEPTPDAAEPTPEADDAPDALTIPSEYHDLLTGPHTAVLASLSRTGAPHASPVWFWFDGTAVLISTVTQRQKFRNVQRDSRVAFTVIDPDRPLRYLELRASVTLHDDPDNGLRDLIARKHGFADGSGFDPPGTQRVVVRLHPTRVIAR